ncbi:MAG: hypothetical protein J6Q94_01105 [Clostridia bacterium]|nr:hypothetical protein [Clostridia bacterium]
MPNALYYSVEKDSIFHIDSECASCLCDAAKLALNKVLAAVIEHELDCEEKCVIRLRWFSRMKISQIALMLNQNREHVRRTLKRAEQKIYKSLKYVVLFDTLVGTDDDVPKDFHFKIVSCIDGKELIS